VICRVYFVRNLLALVPKSHQSMVAALFRTIFAQPDPATVATTWDAVRDQLAALFPKIGPLMDEANAEVLAFSAFPRSRWSNKINKLLAHPVTAKRGDQCASLIRTRVTSIVTRNRVDWW
jgi:transposase-like protein